jgi:inosine/xanthosine triphosphatase
VIVAVGSTRGPKVDAVHRALARLAGVAPVLGGQVLARDPGPLGPAMPLTLDDLLDGARRRADRARHLVREEGVEADLGVGLEGGLDVRREGGATRGFLMSWAYVTDGRRGAHGCGGAIELPRSLLAGVLDDGLELAAVVDRVSGQSDVRSRQGAWGWLTRGVLGRSDSFEVAVLNALAPFYNAEAYR